MTAASTFSDHLIDACTRSLDWPAFLDGYAATLREVEREATFTVHGLKLHAPSGVYSPHQTSSTRFFMDRFAAAGLDKPFGSLLEMGCGSGGVALLAARYGWKVSACDIDERAVGATMANALANGLRVNVRWSDLYDGFRPGERFDVVVFNPPLFHTAHDVAEGERTLADQEGRLYRRFMQESLDRLRPGGYLVVGYSNCSNQSLLQQPGWSMTLRAFDFDGSTNMLRALYTAHPT